MSYKDLPVRELDPATPPASPFAGTLYEHQIERFEPVNGGASAFTYRLFFKSADDDGNPKGFRVPSDTAIAKVFLRSLAASKSAIAGATRVLTEADALQLLGGQTQVYDQVSIQAPQFYDLYQTPELGVLLMSDVGPLPPLKDWFNSESCQALTPSARASLCGKIGHAIACFIGKMHANSLQEGSPEGDMKSKPSPRTKAIKKMMNLLYYAQLEAKCPEADDAAKDVIRRAATEGSQDNMEASDVLVHGDFGARNILIDAADLDHLKLFVIDWEMCCPGSVDVDIAQFVAVALCIKTHCEPICGSSLLSSFLKTYEHYFQASSLSESLDYAKIGRRTAAGVLSLAHEPLLGYLGQGFHEPKEEGRLMEEFRAWAMELLRCSQLEKGGAQAKELIMRYNSDK